MGARRRMTEALHSYHKVDSRPITAWPPSRIISIRPDKSSITWAAVVVLGRPDTLALGAAIKPPAARIKAAAIRRLASALLPYPGRLWSRKVPDPSWGKSESVVPARRHPSFFLPFPAPSPQFYTDPPVLLWCTIRGLSEGRPLAA